MDLVDVELVDSQNRKKRKMVYTSDIEPKVGLEPTTLRFLVTKSHTLYRFCVAVRIWRWTSWEVMLTSYPGECMPVVGLEFAI